MEQSASHTGDLLRSGHTDPGPQPGSPGLQAGSPGLLRELHGNEEGLATAEYGIVMLAAVGFAGLLVTILSSGAVQGFLNSLIERALTP